VKHEVSGERGFNGNSSPPDIPRFSDENHIRILAERPQNAGEIQPDIAGV
jgi:hypothetical protein